MDYVPKSEEVGEWYQKTKWTNNGCKSHNVRQLMSSHHYFWHSQEKLPLGQGKGNIYRYLRKTEESTHPTPQMDDDILDGMESADTDGTVPIGCRRCCLKTKWRGSKKHDDNSEGERRWRFMIRKNNNRTNNESVVGVSNILRFLLILLSSSRKNQIETRLYNIYIQHGEICCNGKFHDEVGKVISTHSIRWTNVRLPCIGLICQNNSLIVRSSIYVLGM